MDDQGALPSEIDRICGERQLNERSMPKVIKALIVDNYMKLMLSKVRQSRFIIVHSKVLSLLCCNIMAFGFIYKRT